MEFKMGRKINNGGSVLRAWMVLNGVKQSQVSKAVNVSPATVSMTIAGCRHNKDVLGYLESIGCPAHILYVTKTV